LHAFWPDTIAQRVNQILALGAKIVFTIEGTSTRCSISRPLEGTDIGDMAVAHVDDSLCFRMANNPQNVPQTGDHIMLPRFVVYNSVDPASFHTSLIENTSASAAGQNIDALDRIKMRGDEENFISSIDLLTRDPAARQDRSYCGLQPYLMLITSEAEHEFVKSIIFDRFGAWQNG
jgi:hypothetical protein